MTIADIENLITISCQLLKQQDLKIATAESCTGGGLSFWLTNLAGSSAWFERGYVVYSNKAKTQMLGIKAAMLKKYGAVSEEVARAMAESALKLSKADISIAITGIAGPEGGTAKKPVGTVWLAWSNRDATHSALQKLSGDRTEIRQQSIIKALEGLIVLLNH